MKQRLNILNGIWLPCLWVLLLATLRAAEAPPQVPPHPVPPPERASPRATLATLIDAMDKYNAGTNKLLNGPRASACLDLEGAGISKDQGVQYADYLIQVIDRLKDLDVAALPDAPEAPAHAEVLSRDGQSLRIGFVAKTGGEWLIDGPTILEAARLWPVVMRWSTLRKTTGALSMGMWIESNMPERMLKTSFLLKHWQWLGILLLIALGVLLDRLMGWLLVKFVRFWFHRRKVELPPQELARVERPLGLAVMGAIWWVGIQWLLLPPGIYEFIGKIAIFFLAASSVWAAYRLVDVLAAYLEQLAARTVSRMDDLLVPLVRKTLKIFVMVFGLVFVAGNMGIDISTMLAGLGIGGLAVALASKDTVENLFGSFTVLLDRPFQIGDRVSILGVEGIVEEVGFRSTRLRTLNHSMVTLPNSKLVSANIENRGPSERRRYYLTLVVRSSARMEQVQAFRDAVRAMLQGHAEVIQEHLQLYIAELSGAGTKLQLNVYLNADTDDEELAAREHLLVEIDRIARERGIELA